MKKSGKKIFTFILLFILLLNFTGCSYFHNLYYQGFQKVVIPTNSELRGTIYIPEGWKFITEDGVIKLINATTNEVYAEQIYQGSLGEFEEESKEESIPKIEPFEDAEKISFNNDISYDVKNKERYDLTRLCSNSVCQFDFTEGDQTFKALRFGIYEDPDQTNDYYLLLLCYPNIDDQLLQKISYSYTFGGFLENGDK